MSMSGKQSGIPCRLIGEDGNIYNLCGLAIHALTCGGRVDLVEPLKRDMLASQSYDEALVHIAEYVEVDYFNIDLDTEPDPK